MRIQCDQCGFSGKFMGDIVPSKCPACKSSSISVIGKTTPCFTCGAQFPSVDTHCPLCNIERVSRSRSRENMHASIPDPKKSNDS